MLFFDSRSLLGCNRYQRYTCEGGKRGAYPDIVVTNRTAVRLSLRLQSVHSPKMEVRGPKSAVSDIFEYSLISKTRSRKLIFGLAIKQDYFKPILIVFN